MSTFVAIGRFLPDAAREPPGRPVLERLDELVPGSAAADVLTVPALAGGEQYRFHFDMTRCIGCRCCEVACNEQNNNPATVRWRRVGEIEGGSYPNAVRLHLSMACNHCLEPSCLEGCPVDAYSKLPNGIVAHDAETCIGCRYCEWNCPYGVPQYNPERRVVTKCHMCADRLAEGALPACVGACPTSAIRIESVEVAAWRRMIAAAEAPGVPPADLTLSTTRITLPDDLPETMGAVDPRFLDPEEPHWSLVLFLVLGQWSVGLFAAAAALALSTRAAGAAAAAPAAAGAACVLALASIIAALFHLGRPVHAARAIRAWRHSWLSREVVAFAAYAPAAIAAAAAALLAPRWVAAAALAAAAVGLAGVACSAGIYLIPARPAWNGPRTPIQFFGTVLLLGALSFLAAAATIGDSAGGAPAWFAAGLASLAALLQAFAPWTLVMAGLATDDRALRGPALLLTQRLRRVFWPRTLALCAAACLAPLCPLLDGAAAAVVAGGALGLAAAAELAGRYLFFVAVVPRNMPGSFFG